MDQNDIKNGSAVHKPAEPFFVKKRYPQARLRISRREKRRGKMKKRDKVFTYSINGKCK
jgi:hypothetical protein